MKTQLRIINDGDVVGPKTRIVMVERDEKDRDSYTEIADISHHVRAISVRMDVGEVSSAQLECVCVGDSIDAVLDGLVVDHLGTSRAGRLVWRLKKWWWGVHVQDATTFGSRFTRSVRH